MVDQYDMKMVHLSTGPNLPRLQILMQNGDARFYASILYEGVPWRKRPVDVQGLDPWDKLQVGHIYSDLAGTNQLIPGVDTRPGADRELERRKKRILSA